MTEKSDSSPSAPVVNANATKTTTGVLALLPNLLMGGVAGAAGALSVYPGDLVKTNLQAANASNNIGAVEFLKNVIKKEGARGLYRGVQPVLIGKTPEKALNLAANDFFRYLFQVSTQTLTLPMEATAGALAGAVQVTLTNPYEIIKVRMQTSTTGFVDVVKSLGFRGLYRGVSATLARDIPFAAIYFTLFANMKKSASDKNGAISSPRLFFCGLSSAFVAASITCPMDVIKTRLQIVSKEPTAKKMHFFNMFPHVLKTEGVKALFRGIGPRVAIIGPQFGVTMFVYTRLKSFFGTEEKSTAAADPVMMDILPNVASFDVSAKTVVVTGASDGIGKYVAGDLAKKGAHVVLACRSQQKCNAVAEEIERMLAAIPKAKDAVQGSVECMMLDLADFESVRKFVRQLGSRNPDGVSLLVNNAAVFGQNYSLTKDRLETHFQVNYVSQFLLTNLMLPLMKGHGPARIVFVSTEGHKLADSPYKIQSAKGFSRMDAYSSSKLAQLMFAYELQRRIDAADLPISVAAVHPGSFQSNLLRHIPMGSVLSRIPFLTTAESASKYVTNVAVGEGVSLRSGLYFNKDKMSLSSDLSYEDDVAKRLWDTTTDICGCDSKEKQCFLVAQKQRRRRPHTIECSADPTVIDTLRLKYNEIPLP